MSSVGPQTNRFCTQCGRPLDPLTQLCTQCGRHPDSGNYAPYGVSQSVLAELTVRGVPAEIAIEELRSIKVDPEETALERFEGVHVERHFSGEAWRYSGYSTNDSVARIRRQIRRRIEYDVSLMIVTNKRVIFFTGERDSLRLLDSNRAWRFSYDPRTSQFETSNLSFGLVQLFLSPYWVLNPELFHELDRDFKQRYEQATASFEDLRRSPKFSERVEWWFANLTESLKRWHKVIGSDVPPAQKAERRISEWSWVSQLTRMQKSKPSLRFELLHAWPGRSAQNDERWYEGFALITLKDSASLGHLYNLTQSVREAGANPASKSHLNVEATKRGPGLPAKYSWIVIALILLLFLGPLVGGVFGGAATALIIPGLIVVGLIPVAILGFIVLWCVGTYKSNRRREQAASGVNPPPRTSVSPSNVSASRPTQPVIEQMAAGTRTSIEALKPLPASPSELPAQESPGSSRTAERAGFEDAGRTQAGTGPHRPANALLIWGVIAVTVLILVGVVTHRFHHRRRVSVPIGGPPIGGLRGRPSPRNGVQPSPHGHPQAPPTREQPPIPPGAAWYGFANGNSAQDRDTELQRNCGSYQRVFVPESAGNGFTDLCRSMNKICVGICDWEGTHFQCDGTSLSGRRNGTRVALCQ